MRWDRLLLLVAIPFGLFFVIAIPPMQEPDAAAHLIRMDQIVRGTLVEPVTRTGRSHSRSTAASTISSCTTLHVA